MRGMRIEAARSLAGGRDAVDRFLKWEPPPSDHVQDEDAADDDSEGIFDDDPP